MPGSRSQQGSHETAECGEEDSRAEQEGGEGRGDAVQRDAGPCELNQVPDTKGYRLFQRALHFLHVSSQSEEITCNIRFELTRRY